jgi:hypothetical protein
MRLRTRNRLQIYLHEPLAVEKGALVKDGAVYGRWGYVQ